jgi:hypothetical protein
VRITKPGERRVVRAEPGIFGKKKTETVRVGEHYCVACPFCRSESAVLSISYMYGQRNDAGYPMTYLATCFGHDCLRIRENAHALWNMIETSTRAVASARVREGNISPASPRIIELPARNQPISDLATDHTARAYLATLGITDASIWEHYDLRYCDDYSERLARERIVAPVRLNGELRGWQALSLDVDPLARGESHEAKYLSARGIRRFAAGERLRYSILVDHKPSATARERTRWSPR